MKKQQVIQIVLKRAVGMAGIILLLTGCVMRTIAPTSYTSSATVVTSPFTTSAPAPTDQGRRDNLSADEVATLSSLEKVDDYPLYVMHSYGAYDQGSSVSEGLTGGQLFIPTPLSSYPIIGRDHWGCSLFAALGDTQNGVFGRNFDWVYSPALLLFTNPPKAYASVSMVDIAYLGYPGSNAGTLLDLPLTERRSLLKAPSFPFDGMNEAGLVVGIAAVPAGGMRPNPQKPTIGTVGVIREMLDHARTVDEAVVILQSYNIDMAGGPPVHYLMADRAGHAVLAEFYQGKLIVIANEHPWHLATNFLRASINGDPAGACWRYDKINQQLTEAEGRLTTEEAMNLLVEVSQEITQWSIVYGMTNGDIRLVVGQQYKTTHHTFHLDQVGK